jgi:hypothetical protein
MALEDEGSFAAAEVEFVRAGNDDNRLVSCFCQPYSTNLCLCAFLFSEKPKEAIEMYLHSRDWVGAVSALQQYRASAPSHTLQYHLPRPSVS